MSGGWGYLVGASVTVLGLLFNQWRADRRETARLEDEREREDRRWERERSREDDRWRRERDREDARWELERQREVSRWQREDLAQWIEDRRRLYANALSAALRCIEHLEDVLVERPDLPASDDVHDIESAHKAWMANRELRSLQGLLDIYGSDESRKLASDLNRDLFSAWLNVTDESPDFDAEIARQRIDRAKARYNALLSIVRRDLGVQPPPEQGSSQPLR